MCFKVNFDDVEMVNCHKLSSLLFAFKFLFIVTLKNRKCQENVPVRIPGGSTYQRTRLLWTISYVENYKMEKILNWFGLNLWISDIVGPYKWQLCQLLKLLFVYHRPGRMYSSRIAADGNNIIHMGATTSSWDAIDEDNKFIVSKLPLVIRFSTEVGSFNYRHCPNTQEF